MLLLSGLTKLISGFGKEGSLQKALEIFDELPNMGIDYDCAIVNAALSACSRGTLKFPLLKLSGLQACFTRFVDCCALQ